MRSFWNSVSNKVWANWDELRRATHRGDVMNKDIRNYIPQTWKYAKISQEVGLLLRASSTSRWCHTKYFRKRLVAVSQQTQVKAAVKTLVSTREYLNEVNVWHSIGLIQVRILWQWNYIIPGLQLLFHGYWVGFCKTKKSFVLSKKQEKEKLEISLLNPNKQKKKTGRTFIFFYIHTQFPTRKQGDE